MSRPRLGLAVAAAALTLGGLVVAAGNSDGDSSAAPRPQGPVATPAAAMSAAAPTVRYTGPRGTLSGPVELRARASGRVAVAAVTFTLDGRPIGSDTSAPYALDVHAARLPAGRHRLAVTAVDRLGRRRTTRSTTVTVRGGSDGALRAGPNSDLRPMLARLRRGNVTVRLGPGRYELADVELGSGATLVGSGPDTVIAAPPGSSYQSVLLTRGARIRVSDLSIDGGGPGPGTAHSVMVWDGSRDVRLQRLSLMRVHTDGVHAFGAHQGVSLQDSTIDGAGSASSGVSIRGSEGSEDASIIRTRVRGFLDYGVSFSFNRVGSRGGAADSVALDNDIADVDNPATASGRNESGLWSGGVRAALINNTIARTGWTGIETVGSSTGMVAVRNRISDTRTGIYLEHATNNSQFVSNQISRVGTGINVEWRYDGVGSNGNRFSSNRIAEAANAGIFVDTGSDMNLIERNVYAGGGGRSIILQGSSGNRIVGNRGCGDPVVHQQAGRFDDGSLAVPRGNVVADNRSLGC